MREQWCRQQVDKIGEKCDLAPETVKEIKKVAGFVEDHPALASSSTKAIEPLMKIKDPEIKEKAISAAEKILKRKTPTGGIIKKRLTKPEVEEIIEKVSPPEIKKPIPASTSGSYQPGELTRTNLPPQPSLAAQQKAKEPEVDANGFFVTTPAKSQAQIRKENLALLEESCDLMLSRMPSARYVTIIELAMSEFPGEFPTKSQVISAALDLFNARKK